MRFIDEMVEAMGDCDHPGHELAMLATKAAGDLALTFLLEALCGECHGMEVADFAFERLCEIRGISTELLVYREAATIMGRHVIDLVLIEQAARDPHHCLDGLLSL